ncbi:RNA repair transcriptional activator RtcR [Cupriavidus basilensis]|uniref:RNA repair transcriptional activator RtcR n=1 Tax=Cupriavidus basilensis TaxID=68895 RepID=UPI0023E8930F|nr:RNA repair transcriptional activator RtcR [Cupriavidus basilensis]MDF3883368.1 RNA repair transcriptional activator RtcR [Cupriavidus basilensis]
MKKVVIGFIGTQLDRGKGSARWEKWRPTVALCQHEDLLVDRFELLYTARHRMLAEQVAADIAKVSPETEVRLNLLALEDPWDFSEVYASLHEFARGYRFDTEREDYWVHITTGTHVAQICLFLLTEARYLPACLLQTSPPLRQASGQPGSYAAIDLDLSRYDQLAARFSREQQDAVSLLKSGIATRNPAFNRMIDEIERVVLRSRAPVLLTGPTGAGKSFLARRVFELKKGRHQLSGGFVEVNCATIRGDGAMSALFGHVKGAFTGAQGERTGWLRSAHQGLLFLDEIGELGLDEQAMLLKAIEEKRFFPVGGDKEVQSDFQLIAGTNLDLRVEVRAGRFREDLFARINLWTYRLPGLAERPEDVEPNLDYELARQARELGSQVRFNKEARLAWLDFAVSPQACWRGNFRDLAASVTRMMTLADSGRIDARAVDAEITRLSESWQDGGDEQENGKVPGQPLAQALLDPAVLAATDPFDLVQLDYVLGVCQRSRSQAEAGRQLFAVSRLGKSSSNDSDRLAKYLGKFGLTFAAASRA